MYMDAIIAGFGGQGVMLIGNLLAYAGMHHGLEVTYIPVYGPEMRGGTANCTVVLADEPIGSPIIHTPQSLIIMNQPSLAKFGPRLVDGGTLVLNSSLVTPNPSDASRVRVVAVPANEIADNLGNSRMANMVALGAYVAATAIVPLPVVEESLSSVISSHYAHLIPKNAEALRAGAAHVTG
jgi:2-oxoglutarate ferredoxin oxidoreductase subunit gamma